MNNFDIDTKELYSLGMDIMKLANELNEEVDELFSKLCSINTTMGVWTGESATDFVANAKIEKTEYVKLKNSLYKYGKTLCDIATEYDNTILKVGV